MSSPSVAKCVRLASSNKMSVPSDDEGTFTLAVRLKKEQLDGSFVVLAEEAEGAYMYKWETCAICLEPVKGFCEGVYLACQKHCFHGRCIVPHLQKDRRCPVCRHAPTSRQEDTILDMDTGDMDAGDWGDDDEGIAASVLFTGFTHRTLNRALVCLGLPEEDNFEDAAASLAIKLVRDLDATSIDLETFSTHVDVANIRMLWEAVKLMLRRPEVFLS